MFTCLEERDPHVLKTSRVTGEWEGDKRTPLELDRWQEGQQRKEGLSLLMESGGLAKPALPTLQQCGRAQGALDRWVR